jgi:hypothetical protein
MSTIRSTLFGGTKRRVASLGALIAIVAASSAFAAWLAFSGASGSGGTTGETVQHVDALTFRSAALKAGDQQVSPGKSAVVRADITNNSTDPVRLLTLSSTGISSDKSACDTSTLRFTVASGLAGASVNQVPAGTTWPATQIGTLSAPSDLDIDCAGATFTVAVTGTTQP